MAKLSIEEIIAAVKELTVVELNDLVKACEEEFGVSAAAGVCENSGADSGHGGAGGGGRYLLPDQNAHFRRIPQTKVEPPQSPSGSQAAVFFAQHHRSPERAAEDFSAAASDLSFYLRRTAFFHQVSGRRSPQCLRSSV